MRALLEQSGVVTAEKALRSEARPLYGGPYLRLFPDLSGRL